MCSIYLLSFSFSVHVLEAHTRDGVVYASYALEKHNRWRGICSACFVSRSFQLTFLIAGDKCLVCCLGGWSWN